MPKINLTSVLVDDQERALSFYTDVLGGLSHFLVLTGVSESMGGRAFRL